MKKLVACWILLALGPLQLCGAAQTNSITFTNVSDIRRLSRDQATLGQPARLRGVVTCSDPRWSLLFLHDASAGIFVALSGDQYPTNGEFVEISGVTGDGSFLPVVTAASWRHLGSAEMPLPHRVGLSDRFFGDIDSEWAELVGVVRQVSLTTDQDHLQIDLAGKGWRARAFLPLSKPYAPAEWNPMVDATVSVLGVCGVDFDDIPGGLRLKTFIPSAAGIRVLEPCPGQASGLPYTSLEKVRAFSTTNIPVHRIHIRGTVTHRNSYGDMVVQEGAGAVVVRCPTNDLAALGDSVDAAGFLATGLFSPVLEDASVRRGSLQQPVRPVSVAPATVLWGGYDARLVQLTGVLQSQTVSATNLTLLLLQDGILFGASLASAKGEVDPAQFKKGVHLQVTGVCSLQGGQNGAPQSFEIRLRSMSDVVALPPTRVFSGRQVLGLLAVAGLAWGLVLLWGVALRRRVSEQTRELASSLSLLTAAIESTADGVLVVDREGRITSYNQIFSKMWSVPRELIESRHDSDLLTFASAQLKDPEAFLGKVRELYETPGAESFDTLEFKDGRVFERYSQPQRLDGNCVGRVWCFRNVTERKLAENRFEAVHQQLLEASHRAGMAEVATSVLHNVGNVLNSVNVSASLVDERLRRSRASNLAPAAELIEHHMNDLKSFLTADPKGEKLRVYLRDLSSTLLRENEGIRTEIATLRKNIEHIKTIVAMQQSHARPTASLEWLDPKDLMEHAVQINLAAYESDQITLLREYQGIGPMLLDRHKVLQVLINLLSNARYALSERPPRERRVTLGISTSQSASVVLRVADNGIGIDPLNLDRIFHQGFTTRPDGHGFGLHSSSTAAQEMSGSLSVQSDGVGKGATFTLELPARSPAEQESS